MFQVSHLYCRGYKNPLYKNWLCQKNCKPFVLLSQGIQIWNSKIEARLGVQLRIQLRAQLDAQIEAQLGESWAQIEAFLPLLEPILVSHSIHIVQMKEQETIFRKHFFLIFSHSIYLAKIFLSSSRVVVVLVVVVSLSHGAHMWNYVQTFMEYRVIFSFWFLAVGVFFFWADKTDMLFIDWWCIFLPYRYIKWAKASTENNCKVNGTVPIIWLPRWQG